jgi:hypothetical protein
MIDYDSHVIFNDNDSDLKPIVVPLPTPPAHKEIQNWDLPVEQQKWRHMPMPAKLQELQENIKLTPSEKVKHLEKHKAYYEDEIEFISKDWDRRINGMWLYIKGKAFYITGDNYYYLQWWPIEGKPVQFRMRDRKWWLFVEFIDKDPYTFGFNYPKHRREGATTRVSCKRFLVATTQTFARVGLQSKEEKHAAEVHKTFMLDNFRYYTPFWHVPVWDSDERNKTSIRFYAPTSKDHVDYGKKSLKSIIDYMDSGAKAYDGLKLKYLHGDEVGKTTEVDIKVRWEIQRSCLSDGSRVIGKCINTSTVDEMDKGGGKQFKRLADQSHYHEKNESGRTTSGLYNLFIPADEGYDGVDVNGNQFIDDYGFDVLDENGKTKAHNFHESIRDGYRKAGDIEGLIEYTRQYPLKWKDCWRRTARDCNFNLSIIEERMDYYRMGNPDIQRGNFMWLNAKQDTEVIWVPDPEGKFNLSYQFDDPRKSNSFHYEDGVKKPNNVTRFVAGGDPFKFKDTRGGKKSLGGGAVFMMYDSSIDSTKDIDSWTTNRLVCTYNFRPNNKNLYGEDMLMMCVYFGCQMFPEINVDFLWDYFDNRGYGGYLFFPIDPHTGKISRTPGAQTGEKIREEIFREIQYYIEMHGRREKHMDFLEQCKEIEDDMGDFDLFTAAGLSLIASKRNSIAVKDSSIEDFPELFPTFYY